MTITFVYTFNLFVMNLVEGIALILVYSMFILSSRNQPRENRTYQLLRNSGIYGIVLSFLPIATPLLYCPSCTIWEILFGKIYGFSITMLFLTPMLISLATSLLLVGKRNKETYGQILIVSGFLWILAFFGNAIGLVIWLIDMWWWLAPLGLLSYLAVPASILMIIHGIKFKDKYFVLAGFFYIISWSVELILTLFPFPLF